MKKLALLAIVAAASVVSAANIYDAGGFEGFAVANLNGQFDWAGTVGSGGYDPAIVDLGSPAGKVLKLSTPIPRNPDGTGNFRRESIATVSFADQYNAAYPVTVKFDIWLPDTFQNVYFNQGASANFAQTINDGKWIRVFSGGAQTAGGTFPTSQWVSVEMTWDFAANLRTSKVNGVPLDTALTYSSANPFNKFNIRVVTDNRPGGPEALAYLDNFVVTPEPTSLLLLGLTSLLLRRR